MLTMNKTFDQIVYESTATEIIEGLAESLMESRSAGSTYSSVTGIDVAVSEVEFSENIRKMYQKYHKREDNEPVKVSSYLNKEMQIMKVGRFDMSINQCVAMALEISKNAGNKFYGILLSTNNNKSPTKKRMTFNPLHPIIASELMEPEPPVSLTNPIWTINVFAWKDSFDPEKFLPTAFNDQNYIPDIAEVLAAMSKKSLYTIRNTNVRAAVEDFKFVINYEQKKFHISNGKEVKDVDGGRRNWIVPLQILNNGGIAYPYYGSVYTKNGIAWNLTPMMSANISEPENDSRFEGGGRICTKSGDSKTIKGVSALNHSNLTSPLNSACYRIGSLTYANHAMMAAMEILTGESLTGTPSVEKPLTFKEFMEEDKTLNAKAYLRYMRDFVSGATLKKEDTVIMKPEFPNWEAGRNYVVGDVVMDPTYVDGVTLRVMTNRGWADYIPPVDLNDMNITPAPEAPIMPEAPPVVDPNPWRGDLHYGPDAQATRRGWVYQVRNDIQQTTQEEPTAFAGHWNRVRPVTTTEEVV